MQDPTRRNAMLDGGPHSSAGFAPLVAKRARVLILGSLPSQISLQEKEYYANPRNAFWPIMGELFGAGPELPYEQRVALLTRAGIAVWDVLASSVRPGSLDAAIQPDTATANDFAAFFERYPEITMICFNGRKARELFIRLVARTSRRQYAGMQQVLLPSTSPAHASMPFAEKLRAWTVLRTAYPGLRSK